MTTTPAPIFIVTSTDRAGSGGVIVNDAIASNFYFTNERDAQDFVDCKNEGNLKGSRYRTMGLSPAPVAP